MNKKITIDILATGFPKFLEKETNNEGGWIKCIVEIAEDKIWIGRVVRISSSGKYEVELLEKKKL